jgi:putative transcriptional regulator
MLKYKIDILEALKNKGYSTYKLRKDKIMGEATLQKYRNSECIIAYDNLNLLCKLLECQPGDIIEYIADVE